MLASYLWPSTTMRLLNLRIHIDGPLLRIEDFNEIILLSQMEGGAFPVNSADKFRVHSEVMSY